MTAAHGLHIGVRTVYEIHPLQDARWSELVDRHPRSSAFHSVAWLKALERTYGFEPAACTTSPPGARLENGLVFCRVASRLTGRRIVSLPFSDHCEPLVDDAGERQLLVLALEQRFREEGLRYVEIRAARPVAGAGPLCRPSQSFCLHELDLRPDLATLFRNCHKSCTQRKIRRARREGLTYESGSSQPLLDAFYDLLLLTRRRHGIPPQPKRWFRNLIECFGEALQIRLACKGERPVAAMLTLRHKQVLMYKYGCSDAAFQNLGGTQLLFWKTIEEARREGLRTFDLGRSGRGDAGLIAFKDRLGSARSCLVYSRISLSPPAETCRDAGPGWVRRIGTRILARLPGSLLRTLGGMLYRHVA